MRTVTVSLPEATQQFRFPLARLTVDARTLRGSYIGSRVQGRDISALIGLYRQERMPVDRLATRTLALGGSNDAMDALAESRAVRQVITFG